MNPLKYIKTTTTHTQPYPPIHNNTKAAIFCYLQPPSTAKTMPYLNLCTHPPLTIFGHIHPSIWIHIHTYPPTWGPILTYKPNQTILYPPTPNHILKYATTHNFLPSTKSNPKMGSQKSNMFFMDLQIQMCIIMHNHAYQYTNCQGCHKVGHGGMHPSYLFTK